VNVLHLEAGKNWGGQEIRNLIEAQWLLANGHQAWLACDPTGESYKKAPEFGVPVIPFRMHEKHLFLWNVMGIWRFCRKNSVDIIQTHSSRDSWLCFPMHLFGHNVVRSRNINVPISRPRRAFIYRHGCKRIVAAAECIRKDLIEISKVAPERVEVIGEGIELHLYGRHEDRVQFRRELGIGDEIVLVGMVAMLRHEKGAGDFVSAAIQLWKSNPQLKFVLAGDGPFRGELEQQIRSFEQAHPKATGAIQMLGYRKDIPRILAGMDIVAIPSYSEARCRVLAEAFASRTAVVGTEVGGIPEVLKHQKNGLLVPPAKPAALAKSIKLLADNPQLREQLSSAGLATARDELSIDSVMQKTVALYERLICETSRQTARITRKKTVLAETSPRA
jgi:glycosyltransferase involved in cell wall biosynthesis